MLQRQSKLFRHILKQGYSQDFVLQVLSMQGKLQNKTHPLDQVRRIVLLLVVVLIVVLLSYF